MGRVHLTVADLDRALAFYRDALGWRVVAGEVPVPVHAAAGAGGGRTVGLSASGEPPAALVLTEQPGARPQPARTSGLYHVAFLHPDRATLARLLRRLLELQVPLEGASDHLVSEAIYLADPDGHGIEVYADRPRDRWPRRDGQLQIDTLPLDLADLLAQAPPDAPWTGAHPAARIGHIHLRTADIAAAAAFYRDLLGFEEVAWYGPRALFLAAGGYHHHIGLNTWAGVGVPPPPPDSVRLVAWAVALPRREALRALAQRVLAAAPERVLGAYDAGSEVGLRLRGPDEVEVDLVAPAPLRPRPPQLLDPEEVVRFT